MPPWSTTAWEQVDDLAATAGLDYTVIGRRILLWDTHVPIGRLPTMTDGDFSDSPIVTEYGMQTAHLPGGHQRLRGRGHRGDREPRPPEGDARRTTRTARSRCWPPPTARRRAASTETLTPAAAGGPAVGSDRPGEPEHRGPVADPADRAGAGQLVAVPGLRGRVPAIGPRGVDPAAGIGHLPGGDPVAEVGLGHGRGGRDTVRRCRSSCRLRRTHGQDPDADQAAEDEAEYFTQ